MKDKTKRVLLLSARINERTRENEKDLNELEKLIEIVRAPSPEIDLATPGEPKKSRKGKRRILSDTDLEAGVLRYLKAKGSITPTLAAEILRASAPRTKRLLESMRTRGLLEMRTVSVKAGKRMHPSQRYVSSEVSASNGKH